MTTLRMPRAKRLPQPVVARPVPARQAPYTCIRERSVLEMEDYQWSRAQAFLLTRPLKCSYTPASSTLRQTAAEGTADRGPPRRSCGGGYVALSAEPARCTARSHCAGWHLSRQGSPGSRLSYRFRLSVSRTARQLWLSSLSLGAISCPHAHGYCPWIDRRLPRRIDRPVPVCSAVSLLGAWRLSLRYERRSSHTGRCESQCPASPGTEGRGRRRCLSQRGRRAKLSRRGRRPVNGRRPYKWTRAISYSGSLT
jgi:hypothetical protein